MPNCCLFLLRVHIPSHTIAVLLVIGGVLSIIKRLETVTDATHSNTSVKGGSSPTGVDPRTVAIEFLRVFDINRWLQRGRCLNLSRNALSHETILSRSSRGFGLLTLSQMVEDQQARNPLPARPGI